jgi:hypothetical protein
MEWLAVAVVAGVVLIRAGIAGRHAHVRSRSARSHRVLLAREGKMPTGLPLGRTNLYLASYTGLPVGDRHARAAWAVEDRTVLDVLGVDHQVRQVAFQWQWEERVSDRGGYRRRATPAAAIELPVYVPRRITIRPTSPADAFGNAPGLQVESDRFNRRFVVETTDRPFAVKFLDAEMQLLLTDRFAGRCISIEDRLLVVTGEPTHRDGSLYGAIGTLPAVEQDIRAVAAAIPAAFWRACPNRPQPADPDHTGTANSTRNLPSG